MKCEICGRAVLINYGDAYHTFCGECSTTDNAKKILESSGDLAKEKVATNDHISIPLGRTALVIAATLGPILFLLYQLIKYKEELALPIMGGIIAIFLIAELSRGLYHRKLIGNKIIAQPVKSKLNNSVAIGIAFLAFAIIGGSLIYTNSINASYTYLLKEGYIHSVFQLFNQEFMNNLEAHTYNNQHIMPYYNAITVRRDFLRLLNMCAFLVVGIVHLRNGLQSDKISEIGIIADGNFLKWGKFASYSWGKYYAESTNMHPAGYYDLQLAHKNGKLLTYVTGKKESPISLKIRAQDRVKVDHLLRSVIANST